MKKTLSIFLSVLMLLSVFSVATCAAAAPKLSVTCDYNGVVLKWSSSKDAVNYLVYRSEGKGGDLVCIKTTTATKYVDEDVVEKKTYTYVVTVVNKDGSYTKPSAADGKSIVYVKPYCAHKKFKWVVDYRATVYASGKKHKECLTCHSKYGSTVIPQLKPATPVLKSAVAMPEGVVIKWNSVEGATSYKVYRRPAGSDKWVNINNLVTTAKFTDTKAVNGKTYEYAIRAKNAGGDSKYVTTAPIKFISTPANVKAVNATSTIKVTWDAVKGASVYRVYRKLVADKGWTYVGNTKTAVYIDKDVKAAETYLYTVKAGDGKNFSSYDKAGALLVRLDVPKLTKPVSTKEGIKIPVTQVEGAQGYDIYRKTGNSGWTLIGRINNTRSSAYLDKDTTKGVTYTYTIKAYNGASRSHFNTDGVKVKDIHK